MAVEGWEAAGHVADSTGSIPEQQARAEAQQCREEKARLQAECGGQVGLTGLIENGWLDEKDIVAKVITRSVTQHPGAALVAQKVISYRAVGAEGRGRVAVEVSLFNPGTVPSSAPRLLPSPSL